MKAGEEEKEEAEYRGEGNEKEKNIMSKIA